MADVRLVVPNDKRAKMVLGVGLTVLTYLAGWFVAPLLVRLGVDDTLARAATRSVVGVICMVILGGASWLIPQWKKVLDTWAYARPLVLINTIIAVVFGAWASILLLFMGGLDATEFSHFIYFTVLCFFVGINEEVMFRGLMFGGLLSGLGGRKSGPLWAAIISSLAFGFIHVAFDIDYSNFLDIIQGLVKTLETGMFGFVLCVAVLEGRNLVGAMTAHAFFDWVLLITNLSDSGVPSGQYIAATEREAIAQIVVLGTFAVLYLPKTIQSFRRLSSVRLPQFGPFVPEEESATPEVAPDEKAGRSWLQGGGLSLSSLKNGKIFESTFATMLAAYICYLAVSSVFALAAMLIFGSGTMAAQVAVAISSIAVSLAFLFGYQRSFAGRFDGVTGWSTTALLLGLPTLLLGLTNVFNWAGASFNNPLYCLILAMGPGFSEEVIFRAIPASNWMRIHGEERDTLRCVAVTSVVFALAHGMNLFAGASLSATLFQFFYAFCLGCALCAVLLRTGSIWFAIIFHTLIDFMGFLTMDMDKIGVLSTELEFDLTFWLVLVVSIGLLAWTVYLLLPDKRREVAALWKKKWKASV